MIPFKPRLPELLAIEGNYNGIILSCRHKDILRASVTNHFHSCFAPDGPYAIMPTLYCYRPEVCIIGIKDRKGSWQARVFGFYQKGGIKLARIYGNGLSICILKDKLSSLDLELSEMHEDVYFPIP
jgi:hypothetical protein